MNKDKKEKKPLDFSVLDPAQDAEKYEFMIKNIVNRAMAVREMKVSTQLFKYFKPIMAGALLVILVSFLSLFWLESKDSQRVKKSQELSFYDWTQGKTDNLWNEIRAIRRE
ncbi:MAG: hypothetical protein PF689_13300 [Deltaproteobacteria bacterium]|jgi:hypothetical protein|nr:hypothetical protein [Deltaproteobacteria bacterium]